MPRLLISLSTLLALLAPATACNRRPALEPIEPQAARHLTLEEASLYLLEAARVGDVELSEALIEAGAPLDASTDRGYNALILAAYHGHRETVRSLVSAGIDPCAADDAGNTALMGAVFKGYGEIARDLIDDGCAVDQENFAGRTALMFAALVGRGGLVRELEARGAERAHRDREGMNASDWARTQGADLPRWDQPSRAGS